jgi:polygalacturonase
MQHERSLSSRLPRIVSAGCLLVALGGCNNNGDIAAISYLCDSEPAPDPNASPRCGEGDPNLPPEPQLPPDPSDPNCILKATRDTPPDGMVLDEPLNYVESQAVLDTARITAALNTCQVVKLVTDGDHNAFLSGHLTVDSRTLWIDKGVTLFMSRNADLFQATGNCGVLGVNDSSACLEFITVSGTSPAIMGEGTIDGQGGEPLVGHDYSWWQMSYALRAIDGSIGNPTMINLKKGTLGFVLYRVTLHNSAKFHVKLTSSPPGGVGAGVCDTMQDRGKGFIVWGITLLTPSKWFNSAGYQLTPSWARNSDGVDPGTTDIAYCGVIACSTISTGDDHIAIKGGHWVSNLTIAHNHFGTGHGMSIGSETYGSYQSPDGVLHRGVTNVDVYDLTIDADSRPVGHEAHAADFNGIRVKSDESRGGLVDNINYSDICLRDMVNGILISTAYNPLFAGASYPDFRKLTFKNVHAVTCSGLSPAVVTMEGYNTTLRPTITLDNVVFDNLNPNPNVGHTEEFAKFVLGPGAVNFDPTGNGVDILSDTRTASTPKECHFPQLPAPQPPPGWKN